MDPEGLQIEGRRYRRRVALWYGFAFGYLLIVAALIWLLSWSTLTTYPIARTLGVALVALAVFYSAFFARMARSTSLVARRLSRFKDHDGMLMLYPQVLVVRNLLQLPWTAIDRARVYRKKNFTGIALYFRISGKPRRYLLSAAAFGTTVEAMVAEFGQHLPLTDPRAPKPVQAPPENGDPAGPAG